MMIINHRSFATARAYRDTTAEIVERFLPMVRKLAWHLQGFAGMGVDPEDLMQAGLIALTECTQRCAGTDMEGFAAYAKIRVKGAMVDQIRRFAPVSRGGARRRRAIEEAERKLRGQLGRNPSDTEVAEVMGISPDELFAMRATSAALKFESVDEVYSDTDMAFRDCSPTAIEELIRVENRAAVVSAIKGLPEKLQLVIQLYFVEELNLAEIASILGLSVPRIHQLKEQALKGIRAQLQRSGIDVP